MSLANDIFATPTAGLRHGRGRPRGDSLENRRRHLLATSYRLIVEQGIVALALADIARSAGVALRTIYLHYGGKAGLLLAVIEDEGERHAAELEALELAGKSWDAQLERLAMHLARRVCRPELMRLCDIVIETRDGTLVAALDRAGPAQIRDALARALANAGLAGPAHCPYPLEDLCDHFIVCITGPRFGTARSSMSAPELARRGLALFMRAIAASTAG
jgi:AcrR family transcriptional regulator